MMWAYSYDGEGYKEADSREDAIAHLDGGQGWIGKKEPFTPNIAGLIDDFLEGLHEEAYGTVDEAAIGDWPKMTSASKNVLCGEINHWIREHCPIKFFAVEDIEEIKGE